MTCLMVTGINLTKMYHHRRNICVLKITVSFGEPESVWMVISDETFSIIVLHGLLHTEYLYANIICCFQRALI